MPDSHSPRHPVTIDSRSHPTSTAMGFNSSSIPLFVRPKSLPFVMPSSSRNTLPNGTNNGPTSNGMSRPNRYNPAAMLPLGGNGGGNNNFPRRLPRSVETALLINAVPFLWGSYAACAKIITNLEPTIPLTLLNLFTATSSMVALALVRMSTFGQQQQHQQTPQQRKAVSWAVSAELGFYLFLGAWLHLRSVAFTSASRSSFFIQFTTFFVPLIELFTGHPVSPAVIPACILTLAGAACLVLPEDPTAVNSFSSLFSSLNYGDILGITSAISYSLHIVRVQVLAPRAGSSFTLVEGQVKGQFAFSMLWEVGLTLGGDFSGIDYLKSIPSLGGDNLTTTLLCIIWIGMATNAFATWAQISGQQRVGASRAAIFYATQPVWAVVLSVMIGLDTLSTFEVIGGMLIVSGSVLLALADNGMKGEG